MVHSFAHNEQTQRCIGKLDSTVWVNRIMYRHTKPFRIRRRRPAGGPRWNVPGSRLTHEGHDRLGHRTTKWTLADSLPIFKIVKMPNGTTTLTALVDKFA